MSKTVIPKKILIMGLDNSGKTSIVLSLTRQTNLLRFFSLRPTAGLNIEHFKDQDNEFNIWDFGGQEDYRKDYLKNLDKYTHELDKMIFVIDIQDPERYDLALQYLEPILQSLKKNKETSDLSIFLHKFDPDLENLNNFPEIQEQSLELINKIRKLVPIVFNYKIFKTSIYTIFRKSLVT